ncbi:hypothetical protein [Thalassomonas sp. RHCl1]|uniref:hypothetical protein n=1 Tax=Thalassomonas sp. RHCl1 TaxID=2995320 RepID=UPI00248C05FA|nr:hypothetical protein [Thalassomonas sp. RHCl1]
MKKIITIIITTVIVVMAGSFLLIPLNAWIWDLKNLEGGYDAEMEMFDILVFIEWPVLLIAGVLFGNFLYKKYLTGKTSGR